MYKMLYTAKDPRSRKAPELTEIGRQLLAATKIKEEAILKLELDHFETQYPDKEIAALHYAHHAKRREKSLLKLQEQYRAKRLYDMQMKEQEKSQNNVVQSSDNQALNALSSYFQGKVASGLGMLQ